MCFDLMRDFLGSATFNVKIYEFKIDNISTANNLILIAYTVNQWKQTAYIKRQRNIWTGLRL